MTRGGDCEPGHVRNATIVIMPMQTPCVAAGEKAEMWGLTLTVMVGGCVGSRGVVSVAGKGRGKAIGRGGDTRDAAKPR